MTLEILRWTVILGACFILGVLFTVSFQFHRLWRRIRGGDGRMFPLHVWTLTVSYSILLVQQTEMSLSRIESGGHPVSISTFALAVLFGLIGLLVNYRLGQEMLKKAKQP